MSRLVTENEIKENLEKFLRLSAKEDVFITRHGRVIAVLTKPDKDSKEIVASLNNVMSGGANNGEV